MKYLLIILLIAITCTGCFTVILLDGTKFSANNLAKDEIAANDFDSSRFVKRPFYMADYITKAAVISNKRVVTPIRGTDVKKIAATKGRYHILFWNPDCPGSVKDLRKADSLAESGFSIFLVSERRGYDYIDKRLSKTHFTQYPIYTIETADYTDFLLWRRVGFMQEACDSCYKQYKHDVIWPSYLLIESGVITPVFYNTEGNILK